MDISSADCSSGRLALITHGVNERLREPYPIRSSYNRMSRASIPDSDLDAARRNRGCLFSAKLALRQNLIHPMSRQMLFRVVHGSIKGRSRFVFLQHVILSPVPLRVYGGAIHVTWKNPAVLKSGSIPDDV